MRSSLFVTKFAEKNLELFIAICTLLNNRWFAKEYFFGNQKKKIGFPMSNKEGVSCFIKSPSRNSKVARPGKYLQDQRRFKKRERGVSFSVTLSGSHSLQLFFFFEFAFIVSWRHRHILKPVQSPQSCGHNQVSP